MLKENMKNGIRFAKRNHHHINRQPIIVIFSTDAKVKISSNTTLKSNNSKIYFICPKICISFIFDSI
jgi:hypothetical protein